MDAREGLHFRRCATQTRDAKPSARPDHRRFSRTVLSAGKNVRIEGREAVLLRRPLHVIAFTRMEEGRDRPAGPMAFIICSGAYRISWRLFNITARRAPRESFRSVDVRRNDRRYVRLVRRAAQRQTRRRPSPVFVRCGLDCGVLPESSDRAD